MAGFDGGLSRFDRKIKGLEIGLLPAVLDLTDESIVRGSRITGAPGQPEEEGELIASWRKEQLSPTVGQVVTAAEHALQNEVGVRFGGGVYTQRSSKGGRFSVALTRRNFQKLVNFAAKKVADAAGGGGRSGA